MSAITRQSKIVYGVALGTIAASGLFLYKQSKDAGAYDLAKNDGLNHPCNPNLSQLQKVDNIAFKKSDNLYYKGHRVFESVNVGTYLKQDGKVFASDGKVYDSKPTPSGTSVKVFKANTGKYYKTDGKSGTIGKVDPKSLPGSLLKFDNNIYEVDAKPLGSAFVVTDGKALNGTISNSEPIFCPMDKSAPMISVRTGYTAVLDNLTAI